jgi:hypothetical protein
MAKEFRFLFGYQNRGWKKYSIVMANLRRWIQNHVEILIIFNGPVIKQI